MLDMEQAWQHGNQTFIDTPEGDLMSEADKVLQAYATSTSNYEVYIATRFMGLACSESWFVSRRLRAKQSVAEY